MRIPVMLVGFLALSLLGCDRAGRTPQLITATGKYELFDKELTVEVVGSQDGRINYTVLSGGRKVGPKGPPIDKGRPWCIFAATPGEVWMWDGDRKVLLVEMSEKDAKLSDLSMVPGLLDRAPEGFLHHLPASLKPQRGGDAHG